MKRILHKDYIALGFVFAIILLFSVSLPQRGFSEPLQFDIADDYVKISTGFTGTTLSMIGYRAGQGDIVMTLEGPERSSMVRKKARVLGAWINNKAIQFDNIPSYYDFAVSSEDETHILSDEMLKEQRVGLNSLKAKPKTMRYSENKMKEFQHALLRNKQKLKLYPVKHEQVEFIGDDLFRVDFELPANVPAGDYTLRAMLVKNGQVVHQDTQSLRVGLIGFSSDIYEFSNNNSLLYGVLCVVLAVFMGWLSNVIVRRS